MDRLDARLHPFLGLDPPAPRHRVRPAEAGNRGYSYPSGGRVRALQAISAASDSARSPQERREIAVRAVFRALPGQRATQSARDSPTGGSSRPRPSRPSSRLAGPIEDHVGRIVGHDGAALGRGDGLRGVEHTAARRSCGGAENRGVKGGTAPRQPRSGTHAVWPRGVCWLNSKSSAQRARGPRVRAPSSTVGIQAADEAIPGDPYLALEARPPGAVGFRFEGEGWLPAPLRILREDTRVGPPVRIADAPASLTVGSRLKKGSVPRAEVAMDATCVSFPMPNDRDWTYQAVADELESMAAKTLQDAEAPST